MENLSDYNYSSIFYKLNSLTPQFLKEVEDFISLLYDKQINEMKVIHAKKLPIKAGFAKDFFVMKEDFDEPLEDFKEYMP